MKQILLPAVLSHLSLMPLCPLLNAGHVILDIGTIRGKTSTFPLSCIAGLQYHTIKNKNRNRAINQLENLGYDR